MKKEELFEALEDIDPVSVEKARKYHGWKKTVWLKLSAAAACAAIVVGAAFGVSSLKKGGTGKPNAQIPTEVIAVKAVYPEPVAQNMSVQSFLGSYEYRDWQDSYREQVSESMDFLLESPTLVSGIYGYYADLMKQVLVSDNENTVCSPLNTYIAFAMLAEVSDGNTRQQILDMLGVEDIDTLRKVVSSLWKNDYADTPALKSILANSLWLNNDVKYNPDTLNRLAEQYYASTFSGIPGSAEMDEALRKWTDDNTGGLLTEYTKEMTIEPDTVLEILSTIYYKAMWVSDFYEGNTAQEAFHGTDGDTTVEMMKKTEPLSVYHGDGFTSLSLWLKDSGAMYFLLPDEGTDVNELVSNSDFMKAILYSEDDEGWSSPLVHLSVPKFRVSGKVDLRDTLRALGVTDVFDYTVSDFTPLTTDTDEIFLSKAEHAAMVEIDEQGITGAAYTEIVGMAAGKPADEMDFVLNRPFMFIVVGGGGSILFSGIVRNID